MATHFSILAWRIPTDRGAWWAKVHGVTEFCHDCEHTYCVALCFFFVVVFFLSVSIRKRQNFSLLIQSHLLWPPDFLHNTQKRTNDTVLVTVRLVTHHSMAVPPCELAESEIPIQAEDCHWCVLR